MPTAAPIFVFQSTYLTYKAERVLKNAQIACRLVTKPRHISSDCGLALRLEAEDSTRATALLAESGVELLGIY